MRRAELLRASWTVSGLEAPRFAWPAAIALPLWALATLARLGLFVAREGRLCGRLRQGVDAIRTAHRALAGQGLPPAGREALRRLFAAAPAPGPAWAQLEASSSSGGTEPTRPLAAYSPSAAPRRRSATRWW